MMMVNEDERVRSAAHFGVHAQGAKLPEPAPDPSAPETDPSKPQEQGSLRESKGADSAEGTHRAKASPYAMPPLRLSPKVCSARDPAVRKSHRQSSENVAAFFASSRGGTAEEEKEGLGLAFNSDKDMEGAFRSPRPTPPPSREQKRRREVRVPMPRCETAKSTKMGSSMMALKPGPTTLSDACAGLEVLMRCCCRLCNERDS